MSNFKTRALTEGAIFAALTVIIGLVSYYIPPIAIISLFWAVPLIIISMRHGLKVGLIAAVTASVLMAILTNPYKGLWLFLVFELPGIAMGYMIGKKYKPINTIMISGIIYSICYLVAIILTVYLSGINIFTEYDRLIFEIRAAYDSIVPMVLAKYKEMGIDQQSIMKKLPTADQYIEYFKTTLPVIFIASGQLFTFVNYKTVKLVVKRVGMDLPDTPLFSTWRLTERKTLLSMVLLIIALAEITYFKHPQLQLIMINAFYLLMCLYFILGLSVMKFFMEKKGFSKTLQVLFLIAGWAFLGKILLVVGFFDMSFDFRKLKKAKQEVRNVD